MKESSVSQISYHLVSTSMLTLARWSKEAELAMKSSTFVCLTQIYCVLYLEPLLSMRKLYHEDSLLMFGSILGAPKWRRMKPRFGHRLNFCSA